MTCIADRWCRIRTWARVLVVLVTLAASVLVVPPPGATASAEPAWTPIDFSNWTAQGGSSKWTTSAGGSAVTELNNGDETYFVSPDDDLVDYDVQGTIVAPANWDNDYFGLAFGYQAPIAAHGDPLNRQKMVLLAWKQGDQANFPPYGGLAREGFSVSQVDGTFQHGATPFWQQADGVDVLASHYGSDAGWVDGTSYHIEARYTATSLTIRLDGQVFASVTGSFEPGHLALFDYSQEDVIFKDFSIRKLGGGPSVTADAGPDQSAPEGSTVTLAGSGSATDGTSGGSEAVSYKWEMVSADGPPVQLPSSTSPTPSFSVFDDGTYTFRLTATDGDTSASDDVTVHVANAPPVITGLAADPTTSDGLAEAAVRLSDPGPFDTHTVDVDWGDGTTSSGVPVSVDGSGWAYAIAGHRYAANGTFTITAVAHDDDGGVSAPVSTTVDVGGAGAGELAPGASIWANGSDGQALWVTGSNNTFTSLAHSNGGIKVSGSSHAFSGSTEYASTLNVTGSGTTFDPAATQVAVSGFPYGFDATDYAPGGTAAIAAGSAYFDETSACPAHGNAGWKPDKPLVSGVYWVPCAVKISGSDVAGQVTIIASGDIHLSGSAAELTPFAGGLVFASTASGDAAIQLSGSDQVLHGSVIAPDGGVKVSGSRNTLQCGVFASTVRISGSNDAFGGASCFGGPPGNMPVSIAAPPVLVPNLSVGLSAANSQVAPGESVDFDAHVVNGTSAPGGGATIFVPVELAVLASSATPVNVDGATFTLEAHDPATGGWSLVASSDASSSAAHSDLAGTPNAADGVTYPTGGDRVAGTTVDGHALASWAGIATITLDTARVQELMDPTRVDALRERVVFATSGGAVRTMSRFSADPLNELRSGPAADVSDVRLHWAAGGIDPVTSDSSSVPALDDMHPGAVVPVSLTVPVPSAEAKRHAESDDAYLARLDSMDGSTVFATVYGTGVASPGPVVASMQQASATVAVPIIHTSVASAGLVPAGDDATWSVTLTNSGSVAATAVHVVASSPDGAVAVDQPSGPIAPGASVVVHASAPTTGPSGVFDASFAVSWSTAGGEADAYGPVSAGAPVRWASFNAPLSVSQVRGNFFALDPAATSFTATPGDHAAFTQRFPNVAFNPPTGMFDSSVDADPSTVPFTDVTIDGDGNPTGVIPAVDTSGSGAQAGVGDLANFQAELTGSLFVAHAGEQTIQVMADDGFILGIGDGAVRTSGPADSVPATTPFESYPVMGGHNAPGDLGRYAITVRFPAPGAYHFELDYLNHPGTATLVLGSAVDAGSPSVFTVPSQANIFASGHAAPVAPGGGAGAGVLPSLYPIDLMPGSWVTFPGTDGETTAYAGCGGPHATADGVTYQRNTNILPWDGISGIVDPTRQQFLTGVFIGPDEPSGNPPDAGAPPAPPSLHFTDATPTPDGYFSHDFSSLSPQLGQVFFIGDAKTSEGVLQKFRVPEGATRL